MCDCAIYEICPQCAPSPEAYERAWRAYDEVKKEMANEKPTDHLRRRTRELRIDNDPRINR